MKSPFTSSSWALLWQVLSSITFVILRAKTAEAISCNTTSTCTTLLRPGSQCINNICTNPFTSGCLRRIRGHEQYPRPRTCNSDDEPSASSDGTCSPSPFRYPEIRVSPGFWESSMFYAWIVQILMSELADVPVTIETTGGGPLSFYDINNAFNYPTVSGNNFEGMKEGNELRDCTKTNKTCCHVLPEVWEEHRSQMERAAKEGYIEKPSANGMRSGSGWYIPDHVAREHPTFKSHFGLRGEENRHKLAEIFKRPTTWADYCHLVSSTKCEEDDGVAKRKPEGKKEEASYFSEGLYMGHFRATDKNNCTLNPSNCTGHIMDNPCEWDQPTKCQLFWNDISLESDGPESGGGYSYDAMTEIIFAANATRSPVIIVWWEPQQLIDLLGYTRISLPKPTRDCVENRPGLHLCNKSNEELIGDIKGSCDSAVVLLQKIIVSSLHKVKMETPEAMRSPAYDILRDIHINETHFSTMLQRWWTRGIDKYNYDPREAVCSWVEENINELATFIPEGYPRQTVEDNSYDESFLHAIMGPWG